MKEYQIITADSTGQLEKKVNAAMNEGWQLSGGVTTAIVASFPGTGQPLLQYLQAMVR